MNILFEYLIVFFQIFIITSFLSGVGYVFKKKILNYEEKDFTESNIIWGFIGISFISLFINFFLPLNILVNSFIFILLFIIFFLKGYFKQPLKNLLLELLIVTSLAFVLLVHSNVNNPDALLYHLPFSKILNEHKILIGSINIHHRFGHISIFQYISSFFYIFYIDKNGLLISLSVLGSSFLIFFFKIFKMKFENNNFRFNSIIMFFILIVSIYSFNRYSNYGNDVPVHLYYYLIVVYFFLYDLDFKNDLLLKKISLISLFVFFLKPFYIISFLIPLAILFFNKKYKVFFKSFFFLFLIFFSILWLLKNILISGCLLYPIKITCFESLLWTNLDLVEHQNIQGEVMAKSFQDRLNKDLNMYEYNQNFEWVTTWLNNHFKVVVEKFLPIIIVLLLFSLIIFLLKLLTKKNSLTNNIVINVLLFTNFISCLIWFLKFPIYRYGQSYLFCFLLFIFYFFFFKRIDSNLLLNYKKHFNFFIILCFTVLLTKNLNRIFNKIEDPILPNMFDNVDHLNKTKKFINSENEFTHYITIDASLCGYSNSPCSETGDKRLSVKNKYGYKIYYIDK